MEYTVTSKKAEATSTGETYAFSMSSRNPNFQSTILAVTKEQFDVVQVGGKVTIAISPAPVVQVMEGKEVAADHA